jgi:hypothetical protein
MRVEIIVGGCALQSVHHNGQHYVMAPLDGEYQIRLTNTHPSRRLAVPTVDGMNVVQVDKDGKGATHDGPGYVLEAWQSVTIPGWRRSESEVANFTFAGQGESYSEQTGRGSTNLGVIGVAVFDEKPDPLAAIFQKQRICRGHGTVDPFEGTGSLPRAQWSTLSRDPQTLSHQSATKGVTRRVSVNSVSTSTTASVPSVGTGYGAAAAFHTKTTTFRRQEQPSEVLVLRYATQDQLISWGVPLPGAPMPAAAAFPGETPQAPCPAPPGWRG